MTTKILPLFPPHSQYCEPFFGGGSIFFAKEPCGHETINDLDQGVTTFFRILRDRGPEFCARARLTEYGEALWRDCKATWALEPDDLERAWKWWVVARMGFAADFGHSIGFTRAHSRRGMAPSVSKFFSAIDGLEQTITRLQRTQIMCCDWRTAVSRTDGPDCLHYLDPPYLPETRRQGRYKHEMGPMDHHVLVRFLLEDVQGMVILSGYRCSEYAGLEQAGWKRIDFEVICQAAAKTQETQLLGDGIMLEKQQRVESVWINPAAESRKQVPILSGSDTSHE
jgi:DNA adenine methylase